MATTLAYGVTTIALPDDMAWRDEYEWRAVEQSRQYTITGALVVQSAARLAGRPITLSADDASGWIARSTLDALHAAALLPDQEFTLTLRGADRTVVGDHGKGMVEARQVHDVSDPIDTDFYVVTLRFIEV